MTAPSSWCHDAVVYQVYVRSFADSNGDGIGDLNGLRQRLDHITSLGADAIWINPHYPSPQRDHGYDIADYTGVEPAYGDLAAFDALLAEAHASGLRVLLDVVSNHCSSDHPWFAAALAAAPGSPQRARFHFRDGSGDCGQYPPNNWLSVFGGPAWTRVRDAGGRPGQWYLHLFDASQPDLNWTDPAVPAMFDEMLRFWFDRGVDGFRVDVAHGLHKLEGLPDWPCVAGCHEGALDDSYNAHMWNQPAVHDIYRSWRALAESYRSAGERVLVGEVWVPQVADLAQYLRPDELHQAFFFDLFVQPWHAGRMRAAIERGLAQAEATGTATTWTLSNHDIPRMVSRYGRLSTSGERPTAADPIKAARIRGEVDLDLGRSRARAATLLLLALPGAVYLYQGEELGLPEVYDLPAAARQDPIFIRTGGAEIGRDGCRIPLPWRQELPAFGFSAVDPAGPPWLPQPDWFGKYAVDAQDGDLGSMLHLYRTALANRRRLFPSGAALSWLPVGDRDDVIAFARGGSVCVTVLGAVPFAVPAEWGEFAVASAEVPDRVLPPSAAAWLTR